MMERTVVVRLDQIQNFDPYNDRADAYGMVKEWVARNDWGNAVAFGNTKAECIKAARNHGYKIAK